jgi:hypothetical protein
MDNRIRKSLGGIPLRINFRTPRQVEELRKKAVQLGKDLEKAGDDVEKSNAILVQYYEDASDIMFEFEQELPDGFFGYDDFPQGEFEYLQGFFMQPTKAM